MNNQNSTYDRYLAKVSHAKTVLHFSNEQIIQELQNETKRIEARCQMKLLELSGQRSPYPAREARRAATECIMVIQRICNELKEAAHVPARVD